ncbi:MULTISPECIES: YslB family protein [Bacillales]|uniref:YslB family protein n=1 Tax=Lysinibacillus louembei TaxID=1470088 RepID=A0ABZ0RTT6_9BACI|nr:MULTISPECIES: YslB family protein [Bacillales]MCT6924518.1 YslB family protein [Metasolibacillus sp.]MCT6940768.1 YslB family protein [Metasolibacillus sp.]WPK10726.1 YslB family protein [Lysinibacillus louembei]
MESGNTKTIPTFGYEILRDYVLSSILGKHEGDVLYWAGKDIARKFPLFSMEEAATFFKEAGWGALTLEKETKDSRTYLLTGDSDILKFDSRCFRLEAGFLAQQMQHQLGYLTECYDEKNSKKQYVEFHLKTDLKEKI